MGKVARPDLDHRVARVGREDAAVEGVVAAVADEGAQFENATVAAGRRAAAGEAAVCRRQVDGAGQSARAVREGAALEKDSRRVEVALAEAELAIDRLDAALRNHVLPDEDDRTAGHEATGLELELLVVEGVDAVAVAELDVLEAPVLGGVGILAQDRQPSAPRVDHAAACGRHADHEARAVDVQVAIAKPGEGAGAEQNRVAAGAAVDGRLDRREVAAAVGVDHVGGGAGGRSGQDHHRGHDQLSHHFSSRTCAGAGADSTSMNLRRGRL